MLAVEHVPLLEEQRRLYAIPRGPGRFQEYLATITGGSRTCVLPPLVAMNPMAREHVAEAVDRLLTMGAEGIAEEAIAEALDGLATAPVDLSLKHGLVVVDNLFGGWTNRQFIELGYRLNPRDTVATYGWLSGVLWVTDPMDSKAVRRAALAVIYHDLHRRVLGNPRTLREILLLEGRTALFAGATGPELDPEDLDYSREVIAPWLESEDVPRQFACMFGDDAARAVGYDALGLSSRAGFAIALDDARRAGIRPQDALASV